MQKIRDKSIDMILCDLPYGVTRNHWDSVIPLELLWEQYTRIIKENGAIALFCDGMFMANLMKSNEKMWRYNLVWDKKLTTGFLNANKMPLRRTEEIALFYQKAPVYHPQKTKGEINHSKGQQKEATNHNYGKFNFADNREELGDMKHPTSLLSFQKPHPSKSVHPTQKPVELCEWLIKTYTDERAVVLDNCMGSGTTGVACANTNRCFIGIEINEYYYAVAEDRITYAYGAFTNKGYRG